MVAADIIGREIAEQVERISIQIYETANEHARARGVLIADTKFEFGLDESTNPPALVLIDEVLTPDRTRFWPPDQYQVGRAQPSFDKQHLRGKKSTTIGSKFGPSSISLHGLTATADWLVATDQKGRTGVEMPEEVTTQTSKCYEAAYAQLVASR